MKYYPIYLDIRNKACVVIGGGKIAGRKVIPLLKGGAKVTVVSPDITGRLDEMSKEGRIAVIKRLYQDGDLTGAFLAFAATDDKDINRKVSAEAMEKGVLLNVVDNPEKSGFIVPSLVERGSLSIAVSTGGTSPAFAKRLRVELEERYGDECAIFLDIMAAIRQKLLTEGREGDKKRRLFNKLASSSMPGMIKDGRWADVDRTIVSILGEDFSMASLGIKKVDKSDAF